MCYLSTGTIRPRSYTLGYPRQPFPRVILAKLTFHVFLLQNSANRLHDDRDPVSVGGGGGGGEGRNNWGWASCLASAGRVTLAGGKAFLQIHALARECYQVPRLMVQSRNLYQRSEN